MRVIGSAAAAAVCGLLLFSSNPSAQTDDRQFWNDTYTMMARRGIVPAPNAFLQKVVADKTPGTALDVGMGQGRNTLMLAEHGWDVTGFDISDVAVNQARAEAERRGLKINAVLTEGAFDQGSDRWDLYVCMYGCGPNETVFRAMKPGGLFVLEHFHSDSLPGGLRSNQLLEIAGTRFTILYYEEATGRPDLTWDFPVRDFRFVRMIAQKPQIAR
jgi:SAM-dependent methyltransferase